MERGREGRGLRASTWGAAWARADKRQASAGGEWGPGRGIWEGDGAEKQEQGLAERGGRAMLRGTLLWPQAAAGPISAARSIFSSHSCLSFPKPLGLTCPKHRTGCSPEALGDLPCMHMARLEEELLWGRIPAAPSLPCSLIPSLYCGGPELCAQACS